MTDSTVDKRGARTLPCRVGTHADAIFIGGKAYREVSRHSTQECVRHIKSFAAMQKVGQEFASNILERVITDSQSPSCKTFANAVRLRRFPGVGNQPRAEVAGDLGEVDHSASGILI